MEHLYLEPWKISFDHIPDELEIHAEVIMHQFVPHTGDGFHAISGFAFLREAERRLVASPIISRLRITASYVFRSAKKPSLPDVV